MKETLYHKIVEHAASRRISIALLVLIIIFTLGTTGYTYLENMKPFDGLYMTFITITTIGFAEVKNLSIQGRIFTMVIFVMGIGVISYIASQTTQLLFESELFLRRAMNKQLEKMNGHYIICGYGRIGHRIAEVLSEAELPLVIVENKPESIERINADKLLYVEGDAQDENTLIDAGIVRAKTLVCALSSDQNNVFTTLMARDLNPDLFILVRANQKRNKKRILNAGADKVISPYDIGAERMANVILRPNVEQFIEKMTRDDNQDHTFDEVLVNEGSSLAGKTLQEINIRSKYEILIIAINSGAGKTLFNPKSSDTINTGDSLILLGDPKKIHQFRQEMCNDNRSPAERAEQTDNLENHTT